jgi:Transposase DNA-binding
MQEMWEKNFSSCPLGDWRLSKRAKKIGKALCEGFGKALSEVFESAKDLKRAYEFLPM